MILSKLKTYGLAVAGAVLGVLLIVVKVLTKRNSRLTRKLDTVQARVKHQAAVITADKEADEQEDVRLVEAKNEIKETGGSSDFRDPNRLFDNKDGS